MEQSTTNSNSSIPRAHLLHSILAHSYSFYFLGFLMGIILDFFFPFGIFNTYFYHILGFVFILLSTLFIFWAQYTSRNIKVGENFTKETFLRGPYKFSRTPTHGGIAFLMIGFGLLTNATFVIIFTLISAIVTRLIFLPKHEIIFEKRHGEHYSAYKNKVKF